MKKLIMATALIALAGPAGAAVIQLELTSYLQQGTSVTRWAGAGTPGAWDCSVTAPATTNPCIATGSNADNLIDPSTAVWTYDDVNQVLSMTGMFNEMSTISSQPFGPSVVGDRVTDLTIDIANQTTTAASYQCIEGTFLATVGANGCLNTSTGANFLNESSAQYNIGGDANCMHVTLGGPGGSGDSQRWLRCHGQCVRLLPYRVLQSSQVPVNHRHQQRRYRDRTGHHDVQLRVPSAHLAGAWCRLAARFGLRPAGPGGSPPDRLSTTPELTPS